MDWEGAAEDTVGTESNTPPAGTSEDDKLNVVLKRYIYMFLMKDEKEERKKQASKVKQTNKAKQHSTPKAVTFPCTYMYNSM